MQVLVWSSLDYVMCVHLIDLPPGETGEERAAGNGPAGAGAGLELSSADRRNWRRRGLGSKKKSGLAPRPICPCGWGVGRPVSHCEQVDWIARCTVLYSLAVWQHAAQVWHCRLQAGGINWKGRWTPEATRRSWVLQAKILSWVAAWRQGQGAELD